MLPYNNRLAKRKDIENVYKFGKHSFAGNVGINFLENKLRETRIGVVVGIKVSKKATVRNTIKRKIREILRKNLGRIKKGLDIVIYVKPERDKPEKIESRKIEENLAEIFHKARLIEN